MPSVIIPGRAAKGLRPTGNFKLNGGSWQATGLVAWYPMMPNLLRSERVVPPLATSAAVSLSSATNLGGTCGSYDGSTSYLQRAVAVRVVTGPPFTVAVWCYPTSVSGDRMGWSSIDLNFFGWYLYNSGTTPNFQAYNGTASVASSTGTAVANTWQHMAGVETSTIARACYFNGGSKGTNTQNGAISQDVPSTRESIGIYQAGGAQADFFSGLIADVRIYNRALSDLEVAMLYDPATRWDLYWQPNRRAYVFQPGGAAGYLLVNN